jgi:hypothetical protein
MRSPRPEDKTVSEFGSKTENFREELPLLITRMGDWLVDMITPVTTASPELSIGSAIEKVKHLQYLIESCSATRVIRLPTIEFQYGNRIGAS